MSDDQKYYNAFFEKFGARVHDDPIRLEKIASLCFGSVADFGCGSGSLADYYSGRYFGYDISDVAIDFAKASLRKNADFYFADLSDPELLLPDTFDTIVLAEVLEHVPNCSVMLKNALRHLRPNGRLIISVPNGDRVPDESHRREFTVPKLRFFLSLYGKITFHNYAGFSKRILLTLDVDKRNDDLLGLSMVVKNEGLGLENAILSCIGLVDQISIAVDNNSSDDTLAIAKRYADDLQTFEWQNSFAKARSIPQAKLRTTYSLILDGHEYLNSFCDFDVVSRSVVDGFYVTVRLENSFTFTFPRIIKSKIAWKNDVHNSPCITSRKMLPEVVIVHDREQLQAKKFALEREKQRSNMVSRVMNSELRADRKSARPYFYLGQQAYLEKDFKLAIKNYHRYLKYSKHIGERWLVCYEVAHCHIFLKQYLRALFALRNADREMPNRWEISKVRGSIFAMAKKYQKAIECYVESFKVNTGKFSYSPEGRDDAQTWDFIGHCFFALKDKSRAQFAWRRAIKLEKSKPEKERRSDMIKILENMLTL